MRVFPFFCSDFSLEVFLDYDSASDWTLKSNLHNFSSHFLIDQLKLLPIGLLKHKKFYMEHWPGNADD